jgi:hypothetical protein
VKAAEAVAEPPENAAAYPEPSMFGIVPASGFFIRHAKNITLRDVEIGTMTPDGRPPIVLQDAEGVHSLNVKTR